MRRAIALLAGIAAALTVLRQRSRAGRDDRDVWQQATEAPDLR